MKTIDFAIAAWQQVVQSESSRKWPRQLAKGEMELCHYKGFLLETYHNTSRNPQLQAFATMFFNKISHQTTKKFFQHATSEIGHEMLAFNDLVSLGVSKEMILQSQPLPTTKAFFATSVYTLLMDNPIIYLGYLFYLEYTPTITGSHILSMLKKLGLGDDSLTFLQEHVSIDPAHVKMLSDYMDEFVKTEEDRKVLAHGIRTFCVLHNRMLEGAFENGEAVFK